MSYNFIGSLTTFDRATPLIKINDVAFIIKAKCIANVLNGSKFG